MNRHKDKNICDNIMEVLKNLSINDYDKYEGILENMTKVELSASIFDQELTFISPQKKYITNEILQNFAVDIKRNETLLRFKNCIDDINTIICIEAGIFEYTVVYNIINNLSEWAYTAVYESKLNDILQLLDKNSSVYNKKLKTNIKNNLISAQKLPFMTPQELDPDNWKTLIDKRELIEYKKNNMDATDLYKCFKCGKRRCKVTSMQTRSGDEGSTSFIVCLVCSNTWKL
uniref:Transcription elongation factor TFIIS n=1 Tax=Mimivirus LCMiAC02 TaxID=2506609 RepID=A0A481Z0Z9_9VIRU|nr:MAG: transcription elongation factor TFIIS [Mimivirus LCMiAC02]